MTRPGWQQYADGVLDGSIPACEAIKLACRRHLYDLDTAGTRGLYFDETAAARAIRFWRLTRHVKGEWRGEVIQPQLWQEFIWASIFGWKRADGLRRFREALIFVPRKNGKTAMAAIAAHQFTFADDEPGAEGYSVATKQDQSRLCFNTMISMVRLSQPLRHLISGNVDLDPKLYLLKTAIASKSSDSVYMPLGRDYNTLDGLNPHFINLDELHAFRDRGVVDVMDTAIGSRRQPFLLYTTTAGDDMTTVCYDFYSIGMQILKRTITDPQDDFFVFIAELDEGDDPHDEATWRKANPNYGVSLKADDLRRMSIKAKNNPRALNAFLIKRLNKWVTQANAWMSVEAWDMCAPVDPLNDGEVREYIDAMRARLAGRPCVLGLDLGWADDLSAVALLFPPDDDGIYHVLPQIWMPEESPILETSPYKDYLRQWLTDGWITPTPGNTTDYDVIEGDIVKLTQEFRIQGGNFDRRFAGQLVERLKRSHNIDMQPMGTGFAGMSAPSKELETLVKQGRIDHGGDPVLRWMIDCCALKENTDGDIRPIKPERASGKKIDGIVALVMALDRCIRQEPQAPDIYETSRTL